MISLLEKIGLGSGVHLKQADLERMTSRHSFSAYLNYLAYDYNLDIYLNQDCSLGMLWECTPLTFAGPKALTSLEGLFRAGLPKGSVLQLILHADSHIAPILEAYRESRTVDDIIVRTSTDQIIDFMEQGRRGLAACSNIPVRNFRLFVAVKLPGDMPEAPNPEDFIDRERAKPLQDIKRQISETLKAALLSPRTMQPGDLLEWARRLFNHYPAEYPEHNFTSYNDTIPLRKQILNADTVVREAIRGRARRYHPTHFNAFETSSVFKKHPDSRKRPPEIFIYAACNSSRRTCRNFSTVNGSPCFVSFS